MDRIIGKDIELSTVLSNKDLVVIANSGLIEQVLMNLATNARDAMPDGGYLIIRTEMMVLDYTSIREHGYLLKEINPIKTERKRLKQAHPDKSDPDDARAILSDSLPYARLAEPEFIFPLLEEHHQDQEDADENIDDDQ